MLGWLAATRAHATTTRAARRGIRSLVPTPVEACLGQAMNLTCRTFPCSSVISLSELSRISALSDLNRAKGGHGIVVQRDAVTQHQL